MSEAGEGFLSRWSRLKRGSGDEPQAADGGAPTNRAAPGVPAATAASPGAAEPQAVAKVHAVPGRTQRADEAHPVASDSPAPPVLPPIDSLTPASDFKPFMQAGIDATTRNAALKRLFADPQFNVMDGLDVYIDDYSRFEPVTPDVLAKLEHARYLFDPPQTRVNAQGHVEDVVDEEPAAADAVVADAGAGSVPDAGTAPAGVPDPQLPVAPERPDVPQALSALRREPDTATPPPGRSARDEPPPTPAPPA